MFIVFCEPAKFTATPDALSMVNLFNDNAEARFTVNVCVPLPFSVVVFVPGVYEVPDAIETYRQW